MTFIIATLVISIIIIMVFLEVSLIGDKSMSEDTKIILSGVFSVVAVVVAINGYTAYKEQEAREQWQNETMHIQSEMIRDIADMVWQHNYELTNQ